MPLGGAEIVIVALLVLFLFGAKRLPEAGRSLGIGMREFKDSITGSDKGEEMPDTIDVESSEPAEADAAPVAPGRDLDRAAR